MILHMEEIIFLFYDLLEDKDSYYIWQFRKQVSHLQIFNILGW